MYVKECVVCGKEFQTTRSYQICCSKECSEERHKNMRKQWYKNNKVQQYSRECVVCGKEFQTTRSYQIFCSKECYEECYGVQQHSKECVVCGKEFQTTRSYQICCSKECSEERNKNMQKDHKRKYTKQRYEQAYKDLSTKINITIDDLKKWIPPFFIVRELECWEYGSYFLDFVIPITNRANGRCEITGKKSNNLVVHHLNGYNWCVEGRMDCDNVVVICKELHDAFHKKYGRGNNTAEQFWQFVEEWEKGIVTLDDFMT